MSRTKDSIITWCGKHRVTVRAIHTDAGIFYPSAREFCRRCDAPVKSYRDVKVGT